MKPSVQQLNGRAQTGDSSLGNAQLGVYAQPVNTVATPSDAYGAAGNYLWGGLAKGLQVLANPEGAVSRLVEKKVAKYNENEVQQAAADNAQDELNGNNAKPEVTSQDSEAYKTARMDLFWKRQAVHIDEAVSEELAKAMSDPETLLTANPDKIISDTVNKMAPDLDKDPQAGSALLPVLLKTRQEALGSFRRAQQKARDKQAYDSTNDLIFRSIATGSQDTPVRGNMFDMLDSAKASKVPEADALNMVLNGVKTRYGYDMSAAGLLDEKDTRPGSIGLSLRERIMRTNNTELQGELARFDKQRDEYNKDVSKKTKDDALRLFLPALEQKLETDPGSVDYEKDILLNPLLDNDQVKQYAKQWREKMTSKKDLQIVKDSIAGGYSAFTGEDPEKRAKGFNEMLLDSAKANPNDLRGLATLSIQYGSKDSAVFGADFFKTMVGNALVTPPIMEGKDGTRTLSDGFMRLYAFSLELHEQGGRNIQRTSTYLNNFVRDDKLRELLISTLESQNSSNGVQQPLADSVNQVYTNLYNPKMAGSGSGSSSGSGVSSGFSLEDQRHLASSLRLSSKDTSVQLATSDFYKWYGTTYGTAQVKPPLDIALKNYREKRMPLVFANDGEHYVKLPEGARPADPSRSEDVDKAFELRRNALEAQLKAKNMPFNTVRLEQDASNQQLYHIMVDDRDIGAKPLAYNDIVGSYTAFKFNRDKTIGDIKKGTLGDWKDQLVMNMPGLGTYGAQKQAWRDEVEGYSRKELELVQHTQVVNQVSPAIANIPTAGVNVRFDTRAEIRRTIAQDPMAAMGLASEGLLLDNKTGKTKAYQDNDGGRTLGMGLNLNSQTFEEVRTFLSDAGITDRAEQQAIYDGKQGLTPDQSMRAYKSAIYHKYGPVADAALKAQGISPDKLTAYQRAAMYQLAYNGPINAEKAAKLIASGKPNALDSLEVWMKEDKARGIPRKRNTRLENLVKAMWAGPTEFMRVTGTNASPEAVVPPKFVANSSAPPPPSPGNFPPPIPTPKQFSEYGPGGKLPPAFSVDKL